MDDPKLDRIGLVGCVENGFFHVGRRGRVDKALRRIDLQWSACSLSKSGDGMVTFGVV